MLDPPGDWPLLDLDDLPDTGFARNRSSGDVWLVAVDGYPLADTEPLDVGLGPDKFAGCLSLKLSSQSLSSAAV